MDFLQWGQNPWGQEILIRISWDLFWAAAIGGLLFVVGHLMYRWFWVPKQGATPSETSEKDVEGIPERVVRHGLASRLFHWVMAASMFVLLFTGFLPVIGIQFSWVTIHWVAGVVLVLAVVYHIIHAVFWQDLGSIWISIKEIQGGLRRAGQALGRQSPTPEKPGKYPLANKLYHHATLFASVGVIGTGLLMMVRVETPFWTRNPYFLADQTWGLVYVLHGLSSVALVGLVIAHVYFAIIPEKRWITLSMIFGWIGRKQYLEHHDPEAWIVPRETTTTQKQT